MNYESKIDKVSMDELKDWLQKSFKQYALDVGQSLTGEELKNLVTRAYYKLTEDYSNWTVANVKYALSSALNDEETKIGKLTVKNLFIWFKRAKERLMKKEADDEMDRFAEKLSSVGSVNIEMDLKLCSAVQWKMANFGAGKKYDKSEWDAFPLKYVADCLEQGRKPDEDML